MRSSKEWVLNIAFNRWQFNRPRYVGRLSESIRACAPRTLEDWERYYFENVRPEGPLLGHDMREHLAEVARRLYVKISEQLRAEIQVKPITDQQAPEAHRWHEWMGRSHARFQQEQGGKVFVVFSITEKGGRKRIWNEEVVEAIREELGRLRAEAGEGPDHGA
jgi:hypothetical protein